MHGVDRGASVWHAAHRVQQFDYKTAQVWSQEPMPSPDERAFLATAGGRAAENTLRHVLRNGADLGRILALAAAEGVAGNVARRLRGVGGIVFDDATLARLKELERAPEFRMRFFEQRLRETLRRLDVAGIDVVLVGRAALGYAGYASFADMALDEAVLEVSEVGKVGEVLKEAGFNLDNLALTDSTAPAMNVRIRIRSGSDLWERAEHVIGLPPRARIPSRVDRFIEACQQKPGWHAVRDVAVILAEGPIEWDLLPPDSSCYAVLKLAAEGADQPVPREVLDARRPPWWRRLFPS